METAEDIIAEGMAHGNAIHQQYGENYYGNGLMYYINPSYIQYGPQQNSYEDELSKAKKKICDLENKLDNSERNWEKTRLLLKGTNLMNNTKFLVKRIEYIMNGQLNTSIVERLHTVNMYLPPTEKTDICQYVAKTCMDEKKSCIIVYVSGTCENRSHFVYLASDYRKVIDLIEYCIDNKYKNSKKRVRDDDKPIYRSNNHRPRMLS